MTTGTVTRFNAAKGFGFIQPDDGGREVFVHCSALDRSGIEVLTQGQKVSYDLHEERGKAAAENIKV